MSEIEAGPTPLGTTSRRQPGGDTYGSSDGRLLMLATEIVAFHDAHGGSTFDMRSGINLDGIDYWIVCCHPRSHMGPEVAIHRRPLTAEDVVEFHMRNRDLFDDPVNMLGTWHDKDAHTHNIMLVRLHKEQGTAEALARRHGQVCIFNLRTKETVVTNQPAQ